MLSSQIYEHVLNVDLRAVYVVPPSWLEVVTKGSLVANADYVTKKMQH